MSSGSDAVSRVGKLYAATGKVLVAVFRAMPKGPDPITTLSPEESDLVSILRTRLRLRVYLHGYFSRTGPFTFHENLGN